MRAVVYKSQGHACVHAVAKRRSEPRSDLRKSIWYVTNKTTIYLSELKKTSNAISQTAYVEAAVDRKGGATRPRKNTKAEQKTRQTGARVGVLHVPKKQAFTPLSGEDS